jgi:hypothetical protein
MMEIATAVATAVTIGAAQATEPMINATIVKAV